MTGVLRTLRLILLGVLGFVLVGAVMFVGLMYVFENLDTGREGDQQESAETDGQDRDEDSPVEEGEGGRFPEARDGALLCSDPAELDYVISESGMMALAADDSGHFALYGLPAQDGRPSVESYELLRDCASDLAFANFPSFGVDVPEEGRERLRADPVLPASATQTETRAEGATISTTYSFSEQEVELVQELSLEGEDLQVSYTIRNAASEERTLTLKALITPTLASGTGEEGQEPFRIATDYGEPYPGGEEITNERTLRPGEDPISGIEVPRPAAASNSTVMLEPAEQTPDNIITASFLDLAAPPLIYSSRLAYPLSDNASLALYYSRKLGAGEELGASYMVRVGT